MLQPGHCRLRTDVPAPGKEFLGSAVPLGWFEAAIGITPSACRVASFPWDSLGAAEETIPPPAAVPAAHVEEQLPGSSQLRHFY